ncbi:redoxin domain-containing protein [Candidatus Poribacteria bacterium]|nr:redoxin domain-containing protein [Candidatus Poribacteria bacterium]
MFSQNEINAQQKRNRVFHSVLIGMFTSLVLIGFCVSFADADAVKPAYKYQEIKAIYKSLRKQQKPKDLEKLVEKSRDFVAAYPEYKRVDEVYYLLGEALVKLERVEEGIVAFEKVVKDLPEARYVERCLFGLGLAYDRLGKYDEADIAYRRLVDHPKYGERSQAKLAKQLLEQDKSERKGELPKPPMAQPSDWIGKPALDFQVTDLKGEALSLEKYRGQVVLLDFWATWCPPCVAEIPNVKKTYEKYKDQKFQIIGISLDRSKEPLDAFIEEKDLAWIHYWDNTGKIANLYKVQAIPSTFLIDGEGVIQKTNLRGYRLETAVAELVQTNLGKPADTPTETSEAGSQSQSIPATKLLKPDTTPEKEEVQKPQRAHPSEWIGKPAPNFQVTDLNGETLSLEKYRGQVVLLDFWATWCGPCITEMPKIKKTYAQYKDQQFQIIGISLDTSKEPLETYIEKEGLEWVHYWDESGEIRTLYGVWGIPSAFLIDGEGIIRKASLGGFDVETTVAELVKEHLAKPADASDTPITTPPDASEGAQNTVPNVKEIIDAAVAAHGGLENLQAVRNIVTESHSFEHFPDGDVQDEGRSKAYFYPDKFRSDWDVDGDKGGLIFDGDSFFQLSDGAVKLVPSEAAASYITFFKDSFFREPIWLLPMLSKGDIPVQYAGTEEVNGISTSVLLVTQPSGKQLKIFISDVTHYIVQFGYDIEIGGGVQNVIAFFGDYRDVDGVKIAHHRATQGGEYRQILITDIALNAEVDEALFHPRQ